MDELDGRSERDLPAPAVSTQPRAAEREHRPEPLSAARDEMTGKLRNQRYRALHALDDQLVDAIEVASEKPGQRVERGFLARAHPIDTRPERHPILRLFLGVGRTAARSA